MDIIRKGKCLAVLAAVLGLLAAAGCGDSSGGGASAKAGKAPLVKMVEEKGKDLEVNTIKLKYVDLASEVKGLTSSTYMPSLVYLRNAFYGIDSKTKALVKLAVKDGTFTVENSSLVPNVQYILGHDGENLYYRPTGKEPVPRILTKEEKDGGIAIKEFAYFTPAKDGKTGFTWSNSGAVLQVVKKADGTFEDPKRPYIYLPKDNRYITAGWFDTTADSFFIRGSQKGVSNNPLQECNFDGTLKVSYGKAGERQMGTYAVLKDYVIHAKVNSQGYDIYSRKDGKVKANINHKQFGTNATLVAAVEGNTFAICDSFGRTNRLVVATIQ